MLRVGLEVQQLVELLAVVSSCEDERSATRAAIEHAAQTLEAEVSALVRADRVVASVGFPAGSTDHDALVGVAPGRRVWIDLPHIGRCAAGAALVDETGEGRLVIARNDDDFTVEEYSLIRGMARVLGLTLRMLRTLDAERRRERLMHHLYGVQRAIARRAPLSHVLQMIVDGTREVMGAAGCLVDLWLVDPAAPEQVRLLSTAAPPAPSGTGTTTTTTRTDATGTTTTPTDATRTDATRTDATRTDATGTTTTPTDATRTDATGSPPPVGLGLGTTTSRPNPAYGTGTSTATGNGVGTMTGVGEGPAAEAGGWYPRTTVFSGFIGQVIFSDQLRVDGTVMAAPVYEAGRVAGALAVTLTDTGSRGLPSAQPAGPVFTPTDQERLLAFAEHVSLAITNAKTLQDMNHALHDSLTGLAGRGLFLRRLRNRLANATSKDDRVALLFIDLDRFKEINDTFGHATGDALLVSVAERLHNLICGDDTVARFGGDEFAIMLPSASEPRAVEVAAQVIEAIPRAFPLSEGCGGVGVSVGVALGSPAEQDWRNLLHRADVAMYQAKRTGGDRYVVFRPEMDPGLDDPPGDFGLGGLARPASGLGRWMRR